MVQKEENVKDKKKKSLYGAEKGQVTLTLRKAWADYYNLSKEQVYECVIHKLQDKIRIAPTEFRQLELVGLWFYELNPELFK